jgi:large repetitive protein
VNDGLYSFPVPANGTRFRSVTGVLNFRTGNSKLEPRSAADLQ